MKLHELKSQRAVYNLITQLLAFDDKNPATPPLREQLTDIDVNLMSIGETDITPISISSTDSNTVFFEVSNFCRVIAEYIGDYITSENVMKTKELYNALSGILDAVTVKNKGVSKVDALTEKEFLTEWCDVINDILEDVVDTDDEAPVSEDVVEETDNLDNDGNELPGEDSEEESEEDEEVDDTNS